MNWFTKNGFNDWRFWAIITFLMIVLIWSIAGRMDRASHRIMGDYPFLNRNVG
jgi:hypothetical protein